MKTIKQALAGSISSPAVIELSKAFGLDPEHAQRALGSVIDQFTQRLERNTLSRGGLADLIRAVGDSHHETYLKDPNLLRSPGMERDGKAILDHVFWSKDTSRGVAARAARASGLPAETIEDMLPSIASLSMGELTRAASGPFDEILRRIPGLDDALHEMQRRSGGGSSGDYGRYDGGPAATPIERPMDTGARSSGSLPEQHPLPIPGDDLPSPDRGGSRYDDLSDILRRGGFRIPGGSGNGGGVRLPQELPDNIPGGSGGMVGGTLYNIIRAVLGALLGFQSRGLLSWLIRLIVVRWGWGFLQRILSRVLLGR
ncbi:MAG: DUF937 domain-containing protein [Hyphomicrobiaceae bacterium]|nr:DUF937 domain-containing protein [Hyphomicrobiaceae bacterium]